MSARRALICVVCLRLVLMCGLIGEVQAQVMAQVMDQVVAQQTAQGTESLHIVSASSGSHEILIERAESHAQQQRGLMFRTRLAPNSGMLFLHRPPRVASMWMENTYIPLDMLFLDRRGRIVKIAANTAPLSRRIISSEVAVSGVLEINAGMAARLHLSVGDRVRHPFFNQ